MKTSKQDNKFWILRNEKYNLLGELYPPKISVLEDMLEISNVSRLERGLINPSERVKCAYAEAFGIDMSFFNEDGSLAASSDDNAACSRYGLSVEAFSTLRLINDKRKEMSKKITKEKDDEKLNRIKQNDHILCSVIKLIDYLARSMDISSETSIYGDEIKNDNCVQLLVTMEMLLFHHYSIDEAIYAMDRTTIDGADCFTFNEERVNELYVTDTSFEFEKKNAESWILEEGLAYDRLSMATFENGLVLELADLIRNEKEKYFARRHRALHPDYMEALREKKRIEALGLTGLMALGVSEETILNDLEKKYGKQFALRIKKADNEN